MLFAVNKLVTMHIMHYRFIGLLFCLLFVSFASAQVTYREANAADLDGFFFDGINAVEFNRPNSHLDYQIVHLSTMKVLNEGQGRGDQHTFLLALSSQPFTCSRQNRRGDMKQITFVSSVKRQSQGSKSGGRGWTCLDVPSTFNWGHWTDILTLASPDLPQNEWIPVAAFIPNFYENETGIRYAAADEWVVLLVMLPDSSSQKEASLRKDQIIQRLEFYGIDTTP